MAIFCCCCLFLILNLIQSCRSNQNRNQRKYAWTCWILKVAWMIFTNLLREIAITETRQLSDLWVNMDYLSFATENNQMHKKACDRVSLLDLLINIDLSKWMMLIVWLEERQLVFLLCELYIGNSLFISASGFMSSYLRERQPAFSLCALRSYCQSNVHFRQNLQGFMWQEWNLSELP